MCTDAAYAILFFWLVVDLNVDTSYHLHGTTAYVCSFLCLVALLLDLFLGLSNRLASTFSLTRILPTFFVAMAR